MRSHQVMSRPQIAGAIVLLICLVGFLYYQRGGDGSPCKPIIQACRAAQIETQNSNGRRVLFQNCLFPAFQSGAVGDTKFEQSTLDACKVFVSRKRARREK